ncbi:hypothetical protein CI109_100175 [Kwoniella shandongensis]|uniref:Uncharacterized protein n=1 Tax=Kwoniella shandongensis TaxID=1734106 RepID=A0A5M6BT13_9TREE|nr:uncharacterized protein CI109_005775 [Kwoniella shandongensis]KAA5525893.1 hypothetical protein CI109_005775 [Kwoniella shandongensis]
MSNSNADALSASTSSFVTSLALNTAIAGGEAVAFVIFRRYIKAIYEPRTYIPPKDVQAPVLGRNLFLPLIRIIKADPEEILRKNGVDPYVFVRFLIMMSKAMIPIWFISWAILLPTDAAGSSVNGKSGLDKFTFGNVAKDKQSRYWAHLILDYVFIFWILWLIWGEMQHWLVVRQKHLINPSHSKLAQANTVLVTGIPKHYLDEVKLEQLFSHLPGGVKRIWLNRNLKEMPDLYNRRDTATKKLESAQVDLIKFARKYKLSRETKVEKLEKKKKPIPEALKGPINPQLISPHEGTNQGQLPMPASVPDPESAGVAENGGASPQVFDSPNDLGRADQLVPRNKRPTYRLKPKWAPFGLGFLGIGEKVDAIDWARKEIVYCNAELQKSRERLMQDVESVGTSEDYYPPLNSAFIHFNQQIAAHMAAQCLTHNQPYVMSARYTEQSPDNVIWRNLGLNSYEVNVRQAISYAATVGLIILWATPVAFVGALSNITTLTDTYHWLNWLNWLNGPGFGRKLLSGLVSGVLPPVLLAVLMLLLPMILRQLAAFEGIPSKNGVELSLMTRYFIFLVIHTFLLVTLASGLIASAQQFVNNPGSIATTLASQLPTASTFFITLVLTQFTGTMGNLLRIVTLAIYYVKVILLGGSPRSVYNSRYQLSTVSWGTTFPGVTVYAVIMIAYCVISPVINGFGACFFLFSTLVYKYQFIWVIDQPPSTDTGGLFFPKAITHVFVGMYIQEVCMAALFFLARDDNLKASAVPQGALMIVLIACTAAFQYVLLQSYGPLIHSLPLSLAHLSYGMPKETNHEASIIGEDYADGFQQAHSSSKERLTGPSKRYNGDELSPASSNSDDSAIRREKAQAQRNEMEDLGEKRGESVQVNSTTERDYAYAANGNDVELGVGRGKDGGTERDGFALGDGQDETISSPTAPGPPRSRPLSLRSNNSAGTEETVYFAQPGGPGVVSRRGLDDGNDPNAFFHPATKEPQRIIWLMKDDLGLCDAEIEVNEREGVRTSAKGAWLNEEGKVQISGPPPDDV